jgi:hypothetical protein
MIRDWYRQAPMQARPGRSRLSYRVALVALVALAAGSVGVTSSLSATAARSDTNCRVVVSGAPWKVLGSRSGTSYTLVARGMPCALARPWAVKFTHQTGTALGQALKGPSGFTCHSMATSASGDHLVYSGVCAKGPHNHPFFEWGPKV